MLRDAMDWMQEWLSNMTARHGTFSVALGASALFVILICTVFYYSLVMVLPGDRNKQDWTEELRGTRESFHNKKKAQGSALKNIWDSAKRKVASSSSSAKQSDSSDRPFGSSYYYAHNNPNAKGGYKDGLRMEDYTMNEPRLLSRNGVAVAEGGNTPNIDDSAMHDERPQQQQHAQTQDTDLVAQSKKTPVVTVGTPITKYQWDDPGDFYKGIATIRIDTLPAAAGSSTISWQDAKIKNVNANLLDGGGLLVMVESETEQRYRLHIPKLYGEVEEVRPLVKPKRLLVRLYKKKNRLDVWDKTNLKAWPHPYK